MASKFEAHLYGSSWASGPQAEFDRIRDARAWAESYGSTADGCLILRRRPRGTDRTVALHKRDTSGDGMRWFRASVGG